MIDLEQLLVSAETLDPLPASTSRLAAMLADVETPIGDIVRLVSFDQALVGRVLRAANSAVSGARAPIESIDAAILRLGPGAVLSLTVGMAVKVQMQADEVEVALWRHSVAAALAADLLRKRRPDLIPASAFTAGLLHDIGRLVLRRHLRGSLNERLTQVCDREGVSRVELEEALVESHHSEIGALIASHWELPQQISWAIAAHDDPRFAAPGEGDPLCDTVFLANCTALVVSGERTPEPSELETDVLRRLGLDEADRQRLIDEVTEYFEEVLTWFD